MLTRFLAPGLATTVGGLLLSRNGRRIGGRLAAPLGLGVLAYGLYRQYRAAQTEKAGAAPTTYAPPPAETPPPPLRPTT